MTRIAVVTGGVTGIGAATYKVLAKARYQVIATHFKYDAAAKRFREEAQLPTCEWDVAGFDACQRGVAKIATAVGPVDVLVNNAGITRDAALHKMTREQWRSAIDIDLGGCFNMCRAVIERMRERRFGQIVNISSINGLAGQFGQTNYAAAKAGIIGFTKALALEGAPRGHPEQNRRLRSDRASRGARGDRSRRGFSRQRRSGICYGQTLSINGGKYMQ